MIVTDLPLALKFAATACKTQVFFKRLDKYCIIVRFICQELSQESVQASIEYQRS